MKKIRIGYFIVFIMIFFMTLSLMIGLDHISASERISEDDVHKSHYNLNSTVKFGKKTFNLQYVKNGSMDWTNGMNF